MLERARQEWFSNIRGDLLAGIVVALALIRALAGDPDADRLAEERISAIGKLKLPMGRTAPRFQGRIRSGH